LDTQHGFQIKAKPAIQHFSGAGVLYNCDVDDNQKMTLVV